MCYTIGTMQPGIKHILTIYQHLYDRVPPLVSEELRNALNQEITRLKNKEDVTSEEIEASMVSYGKQLWPYIKAFEEMVMLHESRMADKLFHQKASSTLRKKYALVCKLGSGFVPVCYGVSADHFDHDERRELNEVLVDLKKDIRRYAMQAVMTHDRKTYEQKIGYYGNLVEEINATIMALNAFADEQAEVHDDLAQDAESKVRAIEQSLAFIGPTLNIQEIRQAPEYYQGKREERKIRWGK